MALVYSLILMTYHIFFQVPLCFILMSGKSKEDYTSVFREINELLLDLPQVSLYVKFDNIG